MWIKSNSDCKMKRNLTYKVKVNNINTHQSMEQLRLRMEKAREEYFKAAREYAESIGFSPDCYPYGVELSKTLYDKS